MVTLEMLEKFKLLYLKNYNVTLTNEQATELANGLLNLMGILLKPSPQKDIDNQEINKKINDETF